MQESILALKEYIFTKQHHIYRAPTSDDIYVLAKEYAEEHLPAMQRSMQRFTYLVDNERAVILPGQKIVFMRTLPTFPEIFTHDEREDMRENPYLAVYGLGRVTNVVGNYALLIKEGFLGRKSAILQALQTKCSAGQKEFLEAALACVESILGLAEKYAKAAEAEGDDELADILRNAVKHGATTLRGALQIVRIMQFSLWIAGQTNNCLGRMDQYLFPYYQADRQRGLTKEQAVSLIQEFYLALNIDMDIYAPGERGQSITLGGSVGNGTANDFTLLCLLAASELQLESPQMHLRANRDTPASLLELAAGILKKGRAYPQFANDDCIIRGLTELGYAEEDARGYSIGADGMIVLPGIAHDIACVGSISMLHAVNETVRQNLDKCRNISMLLNYVTMEIKGQVEALVARQQRAVHEPAPLLSILMEGCIENRQDIAEGGKYNNYGIHAEDMAAAADSLTCFRKVIFHDQMFTAAGVAQARKLGFRGYEDMLLQLKRTPAAGVDDNFADDMLKLITMAYSESLHGLRNERGGAYLPGGSCMGAGMQLGQGIFYDPMETPEAVAKREAREQGMQAKAGGTGGDTSRSTSGDTAGDTAGDTCEDASGDIAGQAFRPVAVVSSFTKLDWHRMVKAGPFVLTLPDEASVNDITRLLQLFLLRGGHHLHIALE